jgi:hypothetical protein
VPINTAVLALVLIFIPGILCYGVAASLARKRTRDNTTTFLQIFMYGVTSYRMLAVASASNPGMTGRLGVTLDDIALLNPLAIETSAIKPAPIGIAGVIGILPGLMVALNGNHGLLIRFCRLIRITGRFSDADVWGLLRSSYDTDSWVTAGHKDREMVLELVQVFSLDTAGKVGEIPILYPAFRRNDLVLEFGVNPKSVGISREDR